MDAEELALVFELVREHFEKTGSRRAEAILDLWDVYRGQFWRVAPRQASIATEARASAPEVVEPPSSPAQGPKVRGPEGPATVSVPVTTTTLIIAPPKAGGSGE